MQVDSGFLEVFSPFSSLCGQKTKTTTPTCPTPRWTLTSGVRRPERRNASPWRSSPTSWRSTTATNSSSPTETSSPPEVRAVDVLTPALFFHLVVHRQGATPQPQPGPTVGGQKQLHHRVTVQDFSPPPQPSESAEVRRRSSVLFHLSKQGKLWLKKNK